MRKVFKYALPLMNLAVILILVSYAWFSDKSNPSISETNMRVTSAEGLVIKLSPDSAARTNINLNEILSDFDNFKLNQMSSADAVNFYTIDFGAGLSHQLPEFIDITPVNGTMNMESLGCIDYNFYLETEDQAKHVYFHKDSFLTGTAKDGIRVAISVSDFNNSVKKIFGTEKEDGITHPYKTKAIIKSGQFSYSNLTPDFYTNQDVYLFTDYNGGRSISDDDPIDLSKVLLTIPARTLTIFNVKVWLEGGDVDTDNTLSNTTTDLLIKLGSANVLPDAPNVFANNALKTITNLDTTMEYAYSYTATTVWTSVVNPTMTFNAGDTVYVRYKEVPGVSQESYATKVVFNG
jgi:hypothetical protein